MSSRFVAGATYKLLQPDGKSLGNAVYRLVVQRVKGGVAYWQMIRVDSGAKETFGYTLHRWNSDPVFKTVWVPWDEFANHPNGSCSQEHEWVWSGGTRRWCNRCSSEQIYTDFCWRNVV